LKEREKKLPLWEPLLVGVLITPFLYGIAAVPCAISHGECGLFAVFFPLMLLVEVFGEKNVSPLFLAALQFPLTGLAFWFAHRAGRMKLFWIGLLIIHAVGTAVIFSL
jgi:hypothetical protein